jgi:hypothetical protein
MKRRTTAEHCLNHRQGRVHDDRNQLTIGSIIFWHDYTIQAPSLANPNRKKNEEKKKHADQKSHLTKFGLFSHVAIIVGFVDKIPRMAHAAISPDGNISFVIVSGLPTYDGNPKSQIKNSFIVFTPKTDEARSITSAMVELAKKLTKRDRYQIPYGVNRSLNMSNTVERLHTEVNNTQKEKPFHKRLEYIYQHHQDQTARSFARPNLVARNGLTMSSKQHGALVPLKYLLMLNDANYPRQAIGQHFTSQGWHCVQFVVLLFQMAMLKNNGSFQTFIDQSKIDDVAHLSRKYKSSKHPQKKQHINQILHDDYKPNKTNYALFIDSLKEALNDMAYDGKHLDPGTFLHILHQWHDGGSGGSGGGGEKMFDVDYFYVTETPNDTADQIIDNIDVLIHDLERLLTQSNIPFDPDTVCDLAELGEYITDPAMHRLPSAFYVSAEHTAPYGLQGTACSVGYLFKFIELAVNAIAAKQTMKIEPPPKKPKTSGHGFFDRSNPKPPMRRGPVSRSR